MKYQRYQQVKNTYNVFKQIKKQKYIIEQQQMGSVNNKSVYEQNLCFIRKTNMIHFGDVDIYYDSKFKREVFKKQFNFLLETESSINFLQKIKSFNCKNKYIVHLVNLTQSFSRNINLCNQVNLIIAYFQYYPLTLKTLIQQRKTKHQYFSQNQIWKFFENLLHAISFLNETNNYHGDLHPQFIYYDQNTDTLKIFDPVFFNTVKSGYYRAYSQSTYISPQILINLSQKKVNPHFNPYKSDIFSIGMVILHCISMMDPIIAYDKKKYQIDYYHLENMMRISSKKYTSRLIQLIRKCLSDKCRPVAKELLKQIEAPYDTSCGNDQSQKKTSSNTWKQNKIYLKTIQDSQFYFN